MCGSVLNFEGDMRIVALHKTIIDRDPYNYQAWYNLGHGYNCIWEQRQSDRKHWSILSSSIHNLKVGI